MAQPANILNQNISIKRLHEMRNYGGEILTHGLKEEILKRKWTQVQAAKELGVKQPRISEIFALRIDKFSVEILIRYLHRLNKEVVFKIKKKGS